MTHTEEDARKLRCPAGGKDDQCLASACMAWRGAQKPNPDWKPNHSGGMGVYPPRDTRNDPPMYIADTTRGYCGLAGRP